MMPPAVILCGGRATRLAALYGDRPKALVPVAGRPFLEWQLAWLAAGGVRRVHLAAGHLAVQLAQWAERRSVGGFRPSPDGGFADAAIPADAPWCGLGLRASGGAPAVVAVSMSVEPRPLGTGGGLRYAAERIGGDDLLAINGDTLLPALDVERLAAALDVTPGACASIAVTHVEDASRFGTVAVAGGRVAEFVEKGRSASGRINGGVYRLRRSALAGVPAETAWSIENDLFPGWARDGLVAAAEADPPLLDMGTPDGLAAMERWIAGNPAARG